MLVVRDEFDVWTENSTYQKTQHRISLGRKAKDLQKIIHTF